MNQKRFRIPNVDVRLDEDEVAVTQTRTFQRLFFIKQLGLAQQVYPNATHMRGTHSIQCLHEASRILNAVGKSEAKDVRMAALLHDIAHLPFSHSLEDEHVILGKHDRSSRLKAAIYLLESELGSGPTQRVEEAVPILEAISSKKPEDHDWKSDVVGNTVCADLLAYIAADAEWTGIEKRPGYYRIYDYLEIASNRLCVRLTKGGLRVDVVSAIMDLLDMRYSLTERVIFHHAKCIGSAMLARGARLYGLEDTSELLMFGDETFLNHLEGLARKAGYAAGDERLVSGLRARRLYKRIFRVSRSNRDTWDGGRGPGSFCAKWRNGSEVEKALSSVEDDHDLPPGSLVLWCPEQEAGMKLARVQVTWDSANERRGPAELRGQEIEATFPGVHKRVATIEDQYRDLWTFWVGIDPQFLDRAAGVVKSLEQVFEVECDPVFVETYLSGVQGFEAGLARTEKVSGVFRSIQPQVEQALAQQAALSGITNVRGFGLERDTILAVTRSVAEKNLKPKTAKGKSQKRLPVDDRTSESAEKKEGS